MSGARERLLVVLALLALGGAEVLASTQAFSTVRLVAADRVLVLSGSQIVPVLAPLGIAQLALAAALTIAGRVARVVLGVLLVLLGAAVVASSLPSVLDPAAGTRGPIATDVGVTRVGALVASVAGSGWPLVAVLAGVLSAAAGVLVVVRSGSWSTGGRRFRTPRPTGRPGDDAIAGWDALTRGGDPTADSGRDAPAP